MTDHNQSGAEAVNLGVDASASVIANRAVSEGFLPSGRYTVQCFGADGSLKWEDTIENLVVNAGKTDMLDKYFKGATYTAAFYLGLVDNASYSSYNAADTMSSHAGWLESTAYSNANRPTASFGTASASGGGAGSAGTGTLATSATAFNINGTATIRGCFLTTNSTKGGTTGTLVSVGDFTGGNRSVVNGDTLNVTYTANN